MCLLLHKPANVTFNDAQLTDMYTRNKDGFGVMYAEDDALYTDKGIGDVKAWIRFFKRHAHREACFHLRMRTHGDVDLENCHPYDVFGFDKEAYTMPIALMHNGILSSGNKKDTTKSDTWHYIRDIIRPLLKASPALLHEPVFEELVADHIGGNNKFALMDASGKVVILNKNRGVEWGGAWFSNTYAWGARDNDLYPGINPPYVPPKRSGVVEPSGMRVWDKTLGWVTKDQSYYDDIYVGYGSDYTNREFNKRFPAVKARDFAQEEIDFALKYRVTEPITKPGYTISNRPILHLPVRQKDKNIVPLLSGPVYGGRSGSFLPDVDYVRTVLAEDAPRAANRITIPMVETMVTAVGAVKAIWLIDETRDEIHGDEILVELFRDHREARKVLATMTNTLL
jgi:hypothetical protein